MRIVSLSPFVTDLIFSLKCEHALVAVSPVCDSRESPLQILSRTDARGTGTFPISLPYGKDKVNHVSISDIVKLKPTHIFFSIWDEENAQSAILNLKDQLNVIDDDENAPKLIESTPRTLEQIYAEFDRITRVLSCRDHGVSVSQKLKAQFMSWADNFYDRMHNKKVVLLVDHDPLVLGGYWCSEMIRLNSAQGLVSPAGEAPRKTTWQEIRAFNPDVLLYAPASLSGDKALAVFKSFESLPDWESLLAVKRGQVFFAAESQHFLKPSMKLIGSMGLLVSAIAGFDSGYISDRDSFQRLRWLEMQRHRFKEL